METLHMSKDSVQPDAQEKQEYEQYVKSVTPTHNLWAQMGQSVPDRRYHLLHRAGDPELYRKCAGDGSADLRQLVLLDPGVRIGGAHCTSHLSQDCQMGRCRSSGANHRIRQFRDGTRGGIPEGRTGIRYRLQDLHYRRTGNIVWNFFQLGVGTFFMGCCRCSESVPAERERYRSSHFYVEMSAFL